MAAVLDPIADRAAGMIERRRSQRDAGPGIDRVAGAEVVKFELCVQRVDLKREERKAHQLSHRLFDAAGGLQAAGPDPDNLTLHKQGREERQADHVIDVAVAQEDVEVGRVRRLGQRVAERRESRCRHRRSGCRGRNGFPRRACCRHSAASWARDRKCCPGPPRIEPISGTPASTLHPRPCLVPYSPTEALRCNVLESRSAIVVQPRSRRAGRRCRGGFVKSCTVSRDAGRRRQHGAR